MAAAATVLQHLPFPDTLPSMFVLPEMCSVDTQQSTQQLVPPRSSYAAGAQLDVSRDLPSYADCDQVPSCLPEPVPLEYVGTCEPLSVCEAELLAQPGLLPWEPAARSSDLVVSTPMPIPKREAPTEVVDSSSLAKPPDMPSDMASPQTEASSPSGPSPGSLTLQHRLSSFSA